MRILNVTEVETSNEAAESMAKNFSSVPLEIGPFCGFNPLTVDGFNALWSANKKKRPVQYAVASKENKAHGTLAHHLLSTLLLLFLVTHCKAFCSKPFWLQMRDYWRSKNTFQENAGSFASPIPVIVYVVGCISHHFITWRVQSVS